VKSKPEYVEHGADDAAGEIQIRSLLRAYSGHRVNTAAGTTKRSQAARSYL
jgi:hypothetical protein